MARKYFLLTILIFGLMPVGFPQASSGQLVCTEKDEYVLTSVLTPAGPVPTALDPNGVYPYMSYSETSNRPVLKKYRFVTLENSKMKVVICPDLGGKVISIVHKGSGKEVLYVPDMIRYTRILPRFYFIAGGIEVSFPIAHSPSQNEHVIHQVDRTKDRIYVSCGERELRFGMHWTVEYSLGPDDEFLAQRVKFLNPGTRSYPWMSWSNAAIPSAPDTKYNFPKGQVLSHASTIDTIDWVSEGPKTEKDIREMTGYFWKTKDANAFGAYTPSLGTGLYHIADEKIADGIKLWSYGNGADSAWATLSTAKHQPYAEIQGGPIGDQSIKLELKPKETRWHVEYWIPSDRELDIHALKVPAANLRPLDLVPLFGWARKNEVSNWLGLQQAFKSGNALPQPPEVSQNFWAPSGIEDLDGPFKAAIAAARGDNKDLWRFYYGTWLAGRDRNKEAKAELAASNNGLAKAMLARLLKQEGDMEGARGAMDAIREKWLLLHPQIVVERDKILRNLGAKTLPEREKWLSQVDAMTDEWVIERRVQLMIDKGMTKEAKQVLLATPFQKVHQTYTRTGLWMQICEKLGEPVEPIPQQLGEDRLARFGAYREFE
ncbi:DUF5107 domain-containing protein [Flavihumibacter solisilvae]|uniref:DUF5107 domain-containing protein n=1 Tax=Flavihumibacter solisilvae TaxID=1349421 RepID=A0A0C1IIP2_9BACT|nr:DUF5107 domain-containing protein [Flavihumibacter solisilvae]KIC94050.1 hypothetical protein OI18_13655 [Flavihumibacter solisilvae]